MKCYINKSQKRAFEYVYDKSNIFVLVAKNSGI